MKEQCINPKYIIHDSGIPIRIPPYLRRGIFSGDPDSKLQATMIKKDPYVGERNPEDTLPTNLEENIRLRKIARRIVMPTLIKYAEGWQIQHYAVLVHGSLAKGLIRNPIKADKSDIDIDLVIDDSKISKIAREGVRRSMHASSIGARIDSYVWNMDDLRCNLGAYARYYLRSAPYPLANKGNIWEEIMWTGIESQYFLKLGPTTRKGVRRILPIIAQGQYQQALELINGETAVGKEIYKYLERQGLLGKNINTNMQKARKLCSLVFS